MLAILCVVLLLPACGKSDEGTGVSAIVGKALTENRVNGNVPPGTEKENDVHQVSYSSLKGGEVFVTQACTMVITGIKDADRYGYRGFALEVTYENLTDSNLHFYLSASKINEVDVNDAGDWSVELKPHTVHECELYWSEEELQKKGLPVVNTLDLHMVVERLTSSDTNESYIDDIYNVDVTNAKNGYLRISERKNQEKVAEGKSDSAGFFSDFLTGEGRWVAAGAMQYQDGDLYVEMKHVYQNGNRTRAEYKYANDSGKDTVMTWEYNDRNIPVSGARYDDKGIQQTRADFTWEESARRLTMQCYDSSGNHFATIVRLYTEDGSLLEEEDNRPGYYRRRVYQWTEGNRSPDMKTVYDENGAVIEKTVYTLNEYGDEVREETISEDGATTMLRDYSYTYDTYGNYTTMNITGNDGFENFVRYEWVRQKGFFWRFISIP